MQAKQLDSVAYHHSLLCALTLPRSPQRNREYVREFQGRSLKIEAGELFDGKTWIPQPVPYGPKARLAFMHICSEAVKAQSRFLEVERSARAFMDRIGLADGGSQYRLFRRQMNALSACSLKLGYTKPDGKIVAIKTQPIEQIEVWGENPDNDPPSLWASCLTLSENFFHDLIRHAVPLSSNALCNLSNSSLALDYYGLFAYRLHTLESPLLLSWQQITNQIGQEYASSKDFKKESLTAIKAALAVYPAAKVERVAGGLMLKPSPPPIPRHSVSLSDRALVVTSATESSLLSHPIPPPVASLRLHDKTIEKFRFLYPGKDVYACEADFKCWLETSNAAQPKNFNSAFLGFAKKWAEKP